MGKFLSIPEIGAGRVAISLVDTLTELARILTTPLKKINTSKETMLARQQYVWFWNQKYVVQLLAGDGCLPRQRRHLTFAIAVSCLVAGCLITQP